jgi:hypothetical protein
MKLHQQRYPSPRRPVARPQARRTPAPRPTLRLPGRARRTESPFFRRNTRHLESHAVGREIGRAAAALGGLAAWGTALFLIGG